MNNSDLIHDSINLIRNCSIDLLTSHLRQSISFEVDTKQQAVLLQKTLKLGLKSIRADNQYQVYLGTTNGKINKKITFEWIDQTEDQKNQVCAKLQSKCLVLLKVEKFNFDSNPCATP